MKDCNSVCSTSSSQSTGLNLPSKDGKEITCPYASLCGRIARGGEHVSVGQELVTPEPVIISRNKKQKKCSYELLGCGGKALTGKQISVSYKFLPCSRW